MAKLVIVIFLVVFFGVSVSIREWPWDCFSKVFKNMTKETCQEENQKWNVNVASLEKKEIRKAFEAQFACYKRLYNIAGCVPHGWESTCLMLLTQPGDGGSETDHKFFIDEHRYLCYKN
uniref:Uncharacterized protein n=1 Tax=Acrobeloides nanus TaxID=290746 RepID=A0A914DTA4_9BILA